MEPRDANELLTHYRQAHTARLGKSPTQAPTNIVVARTLIATCGGVEAAKHAIDVWFAARDPWYEAHGYTFDRCFAAINRLVGTRQLPPGGPPGRQDAIQKFAAALLEPNLRLIR